MVRKKLVVACTALMLALGFAGSTQAQDKYPTRPINIIVPGPPGGGTDTLIRQLAEVLEPVLGTKLVIENKPGGGGAIGEAVSRYAAEVRARTFPGPEHCVVPKEGH